MDDDDPRGAQETEKVPVSAQRQPNASAGVNAAMLAEGACVQDKKMRRIVRVVDEAHAPFDIYEFDPEFIEP